MAVAVGIGPALFVLVLIGAVAAIGVIAGLVWLVKEKPLKPPEK